ncbi:MAG: thioredoxin [Lachnospiraceae bacterium]|nr:thioredoxin [Lachnospiraceae bacterium]
MAVNVIKAAGFDAAIKEGKVFVDFYADWCGPCAMISPIVAKLSETDKYKDVTFLKLNIDEDMDVAMRYKIVSIPTLLCFKDGKVTGTIVGYMEESELTAAIDEAFA